MKVIIKPSFKPLLTEEGIAASSEMVAGIRAEINEEYKDKPQPQWGKMPLVIFPQALIDRMKGKQNDNAD